MPNMKQGNTGKGQSNPLLRLLKGGVASVLVAVVVLAAVALLTALGAMDRTLADKSVMVACVLGVLVGGFYALGNCERGILLAGIGVGAIAWLILFAGSICVGGPGGVGETIGMAGACLGGGLLAGVLYALRGSRRKHRSDYR